MCGTTSEDVVGEYASNASGEMADGELGLIESYGWSPEGMFIVWVDRAPAPFLCPETRCNWLLPVVSAA